MVIRLYRPLHRTALLARQQCARQIFGNCPIRVDSRFCRAHPYTDKSRRCDSHNTLEGRTELGRSFGRRSPTSASSTTSQPRQLTAWRSLIRTAPAALWAPPRPASYDKKVGLVLQGGGALGSYQAGVYEALASS